MIWSNGKDKSQPAVGLNRINKMDKPATGRYMPTSVRCKFCMNYSVRLYIGSARGGRSPRVAWVCVHCSVQKPTSLEIQFVPTKRSAQE